MKIFRGSPFVLLACGKSISPFLLLCQSPPAPSRTQLCLFMFNAQEKGFFFPFWHKYLIISLMFYGRTKSYQRTGDVLEGWVCPEFHLKRCTLEDNDFWWYMIPESNYQSKHELKRLRTSPYTGVPYTTTFVCGVRCNKRTVCGTEAKDHLPRSVIAVLLWLYTGITTQTLGTAPTCSVPAESRYLTWPNSAH